MDKNPPASAMDTVSILDLGRLHRPQSTQACVTQLLNPSATATAAGMRLQPVLHKRSHRSEKPVGRNEEWTPLAAAREKPEQPRSPSTAKNK